MNITTQREIRRQFWIEHPNLQHRRVVNMGDHKDYPTDTRCAFVDFVDYLARDGQISEALAARVTL
jgi:hypothetical protein